VPAADLPATESLKETVARFLPAWHEEIAPAIRDGKRVLIAAHGNSIRALIKYLDSISDKDIVELNIPTGASRVAGVTDAVWERRRGVAGCGMALQPRWAKPSPFHTLVPASGREHSCRTCLAVALFTLPACL